MNFIRRKVPIFSFSGIIEVEGYQLGQPLSIDNGHVKCKITFSITHDALIYWVYNILKQKNLDINYFLTFFSQKYFYRFQKLLLSALGKLIWYYQGYPSSIYAAENIIFCFGGGGYLAACQQIDNFSTIIIWFNVDSLDMLDFEIINSLKHELLHIVSQLHERENVTKRLLIRWYRKLEGHILENKKTVDKGIKELIGYYQKNFPENDFFPKEIEKSIESFYWFSTKNFHSIVSDSALCVIAIELKDMEYINYTATRDEESVKALEMRLDNLNRIINLINKNEYEQKRKKFLLSSLKLFQFITCFEQMPYEAMAYGILGDNWQPKIKRHFWEPLHNNQASKNIYEFKRIVKKYCKSDVAVGFLKFYDRYLNIIKASAIHNNPLNLSISQQVHNILFLRNTEEAYKTLNREFYILLKELKKYE